VTGGRRKLHKEELRNLYSLPGIIRIIMSRRMRWAGHVARMGEKKNVYKLLVGKPEGKRPLGRPRRRRVDNIKMDLLEIGVSVVDWIGLAQEFSTWPKEANALNLTKCFQTLKNGVFWDVTPCGSCKNRHFG
jgi:hypothetical protein